MRHLNRNGAVLSANPPGVYCENVYIYIWNQSFQYNIR